MRDPSGSIDVTRGRNMAIFKNYYQVLGIQDYANADTVKAAFRRLARQYHPDLNAGNREAEEKFKQINEAYETLSDSEKRAMHDQLLKVMSGKGASGKAQYKRQADSSNKAKATPPAPTSPPHAAQEKKAPPPSPEPVSKQTKPGEDKPDREVNRENKSTTTPIGEFFESFLKKGPTEGSARSSDGIEEGIFRKKRESTAGASEKPRRGEDVVVKTAISPLEAGEGVVKTVHVQHNEICRRCSGTGKVNGLICTVCNGEKMQVRVKKIDVRIPAGVKNGSRVRVAREGGRGNGGAESGDLFLQIEIVFDASLRVEGVDVYGDVMLSVTDAVLGAEIDVPTLNGTVKMTIPPGTQTGRIFRLKERGVTNGMTKGDHFVTVTIVTPENLSPRERELYQELARLRPEKPSSTKPKS